MDRPLATLMSLATALVGFSTVSAAEGGHRPVDRPGGDTWLVPCALLQENGESRLAFPLRSDPASKRKVLVTEDGEWLAVADIHSLSLNPQDDRDVSLVPSQALLQGLEHADDFVADHCEELLRKQRESAHPVLKAGLGLKLPEGLLRVLRILEQQAVPSCRTKVAGCLRHKDPQVRRQALLTYGPYGSEDLVDRCAEVLEHDSSELVRHAAVVLLGHSDVRAMDPLLQHLEEATHRGIRLQTFAAFRRLTRKNFGQNERHWLNWWANRREELLAQIERD